MVTGCLWFHPRNTAHGGFPQQGGAGAPSSAPPLDFPPCVSVLRRRLLAPQPPARQSQASAVPLQDSRPSRKGLSAPPLGNHALSPLHRKGSSLGPGRSPTTPLPSEACSGFQLQTVETNRLVEVQVSQHDVGELTGSLGGWRNSPGGWGAQAGTMSKSDQVWWGRPGCWTLLLEPVCIAVTCLLTQSWAEPGLCACSPAARAWGPGRGVPTCKGEHSLGRGRDSGATEAKRVPRVQGRGKVADGHLLSSLLSQCIQVSCHSSGRRSVREEENQFPPPSDKPQPDKTQPQ